MRLLSTLKYNCEFGVFSYNLTGAKGDQFNDKTDCLSKEGKMSNSGNHMKYPINNMI